jgi:membrane-associated protease RseP (regulator of RpoE activity)
LLRQSLQPPLPHHRPPSLLPRRSRPPLAIGLPAQFAPIAGLATLTAVVVIHELGHFAAARWQGIRVSEFSIGFGPPLLKKTAANGISYTLRALPIGGYVSFPRLLNRTQLEERKLLEPGEPLDPALQVEDGPDLLENRPLRERALVVGAGVVANVILSFTLLVAAAGTLGVPLPVEQPVVVSRVLPSSAAEAAGFHPGDRLLSIGSVNVNVKLQRPDMPLGARNSAPGSVNVKLQRPDMPIGARNSAPAVPIPAHGPAAPTVRRAMAGTVAGTGTAGALPPTTAPLTTAPPTTAFTRTGTAGSPVSARGGTAAAAAAPISSLEVAPISSIEASVEAIRAAVGARAPFDTLIERDGREMTLRVPTLGLAQVLPDDLR